MKSSSIICILLCAGSLLQGQDVDKNLPRNLKAQTSHELSVPEASTDLSADNDRVLIKNLALLRITNAKLSGDEPVASDMPIKIAPELLISEDAVLLDQLSSFLNAEITYADITAIRKQVYTAYRKKGFPVVDVSIPEQEITGGSLTLTVTEGVFGNIQIEGGRYLNSAAKLKQIRQHPGERINAMTLQEDIDWLNRDPFASADLILSPGEQFGESDLSLVLSDGFPAYGYLGYENTGNEATDLDRYFIGGSWGNVFNLGHQVSYQYTTSGNVDELSIHSADYTIRLPWRDELILSGIYSESMANIEDNLIAEKGESWYAGIRYRTFLPEFREITQSATFGFDFKRTNNDLEFGGTTVEDSKFDIVQWLVRYNASAIDKFGVTEVASTVFYSPGNLTSNNKDGIVTAEADYIYGFFELNRVTYFPQGFLLNSTFSGQLSDSRLFVSEQFGLGGFNTVRGYDYREVNGDEGYLVNLELRSSTLDSYSLLPKLKHNAQIQFLAFWDFGYSRIKDPDLFEVADVYVASYGLGLRATVTDYVQASVDYGWQLRDIDSAAGDGRFHINVTMIF